MSKCISGQGEYSEHVPDDAEEFVCGRCYVVDEDAMRAEIQRLRADRPSVTDDARAEAYRRYGTPRESDLLPSDYVTIGQIEGYVEGRLAAGRAETTTATTEDAQTGTFEAILAAHRDEYDSDCGMYFGCSCGWDNDDIGSNEGYVEHVAGLLATARTRPTREQIAQAITSGFLGTKHSSEFWKKGTARNAQDNYLRAADAVLALLADQPTKADTTTNREGPHG